MIDVNNKNFEEEVLNSKIPVVIDFKAPWCGYCRRLEPTIEKMEAELAGKIKVAAVNIDESPELADQFQVMTIPTLIAFRNGEYTSSKVNPANRAAIDSWMAESEIL